VVHELAHGRLTNSLVYEVEHYGPRSVRWHMVDHGLWV